VIEDSLPLLAQDQEESSSSSGSDPSETGILGKASGDHPVLVLGGSGQLGGALVAALQSRGAEPSYPSRSEFDLSEPEGLAERLDSISPSVVINAAAFTDVGGAEREENRESAFRINRDAPGALAEACEQMRVPFAHVSTDYVFDGKQERPYSEDDAPRPLQVYGQSKLEGELAVSEANADALIVRVSTLYGTSRRRRPHYVDAILRQAIERGELTVVVPPVSAPSYAPDVATALLKLLSIGTSGLVHVTNAGHCSRLELARKVVELAGLTEVVEFNVVPEPPDTLERPAYSVLDTSRYSALTFETLRSWEDALGEYLEKQVH